MCLYVFVSRGCFRHRSALANGLLLLLFVAALLISFRLLLFLSLSLSKIFLSFGFVGKTHAPKGWFGCSCSFYSSSSLSLSLFATSVQESPLSLSLFSLFPSSRSLSRGVGQTDRQKRFTIWFLRKKNFPRTLSDVFRVLCKTTIILGFHSRNARVPFVTVDFSFFSKQLAHFFPRLRPGQSIRRRRRKKRGERLTRARSFFCPRRRRRRRGSKRERERERERERD